MNKWIFIVIVFLFACHQTDVKVIANKEIYSTIKVRDYTDSTNYGFIFSNDPKEVIGIYHYTFDVFSGMGIEFRENGKFSTYEWSCLKRPDEYLYKSWGKWKFKGNDLVLTTPFTAYKRYYFKLVKFDAANVLVSDTKWLKFNTLMGENKKLRDILNGCCEMEDSNFYQKFRYLVEVASVKRKD
jgi:hypothetical protein